MELRVAATELGRRSAHLREKALEVVRVVTDAIINAADDRPILRVGIDGVDGAGKSTFGDHLASVLTERGCSVVRATVDRFHHPWGIRKRRGRYSPEGFYLDSYDYDALRALLLDPLSPEGDGVVCRAIFDVDSDQAVERVFERIEPPAILIFDGIFLHRPELRSYWDLSILLRVPWERNHHLQGMFARGVTRDLNDPAHRRYWEGQQIYLDECRPEDQASIVIDNTDYSHPRLVQDRTVLQGADGPSTRAETRGSRSSAP